MFKPSTKYFSIVFFSLETLSFFFLLTRWVGKLQIHAPRPRSGEFFARLGKMGREKCQTIKENFFLFCQRNRMRKPDGKLL